MTSETQKANIAAARQLGKLAYEHEDDEVFATADEAFCDLAQDSGNIGMLIRAYNRGFDDAMLEAIGE